MNFSLSDELYSSLNTEKTAPPNIRKESEFDSVTNQRKVERNYVPPHIRQQASQRGHRSLTPSPGDSNLRRFNRNEGNVSTSWQSRGQPRGRSFTSGRYSTRASETHDLESNSQNFNKNERYASNSLQPRDVENKNPNQMAKGHPRGRHFNAERNPNRINDRNQSVNSRRPETEKVNLFSFTRLKALSEREKDDVVMALTDKQDDFFCLFEEKPRPDITMLLALIIAKISSSSLRENKTALLVRCAQTSVLEVFSSHSIDIASKDFKYRTEEIIRYFENVNLFYMSIVEIFPRTATEILKEHLRKTTFSLQGWGDFKNVVVPPELNESLKATSAMLESLIDTRKSATKKENTKSTEWKPSRTPFREVSEFPLPQDVLYRSQEYLYPNVINGPFTTVEHYLNVHFHLMREDFIIPLRDGIMQFTQSSVKDKRYKRIENVRFYRKVMFLGQYVEGDTIVTEVLFDSSGRAQKMNWKRSKRFKYGSLICFSSDNFKSLIMGLIVERDVELLKDGILRCELIGEVRENIFGNEFTMAESEVYFESYHHVLKGLKHFNEENFPLKEYIIKATHEMFLPIYLTKNLGTWYFYEDNGFEVLNRSTWPDCKQLKLNESQLEALYSALTQRLVVIQGPPGTGKTYLGLVIAKILLANCEAWRESSRGPILVVCYTNHALDQFLEGMLTFTDKIVRVGGQSKSEKLANYNLRMKKRNMGLISHALSTIEINLEETGRRINENYEVLKDVSRKCGIISLTYLQPFINSKQKAWFVVTGELKDNLLVEWLSEGGFFQNYFDPTEELYDDEPIKPLSHVRYACSLMELQDSLRNLELAITNPEGCDIQELMYMKDFYMTRFYFLKKKLREPANSEMDLIAKLEKARNLEGVSYDNRWILYNHWVSCLMETYQKNITADREAYKSLNERRMEIVDKWNLETMLSCDIVGITTTGAARQQNLLQNLGAKIVIVEEAAEVMESHVVVSLSSKCEQLILIGDHKQLRPSPAVYELAKKYHLDISLFERMLMNQVPFNTLNIQHRMRPEIADLIVPAIYPSLENHQTVFHYEHIFGVKKNLFFINHTNSEELVLDDTSKKNIAEAQFMIAFGRHLILQGYAASQITILATYIGQMFTLMEEREKSELLKNVHITCVDNFQGEENDIILLSLVRNNSEGKIGFLAADNRVCVALSRAKKGLYIMGNIDMLSENSPLWKNIKEVLEKKEAVGTHLTLQCLNHENQLTNVCKAEDFISIREGGCTRMCDATLPCGHICKQMCHMMGHIGYKCYEACGKKMCILDHKCKKLCWEDCGDCLVPVERKLPCGHLTTLPCYIDPEEYKCLESVNVELPDCKHKINKHCYLPLKDAHCTFPCDSRLPCGHACEWKCHVNDDPEHLNYKCIRPCGRKNSECKQEHMCQRKCFEECSRCTYKVKRKLPNCDHFYDMECWVDPGFFECKKPCKKFLFCGHKCPRKCFEECRDCQVDVEKEIPGCNHRVKMKCCKNPQRNMCNKKCERILKCGHTCKNQCKNPCEEQKCMSLSNQDAVSPCGHKVRLCCYEVYGYKEKSLPKRCKEPCKEILKCSHPCKGTCGSCMQGRLHVQCQEDCGKNLICGHKCTVSCSQSCPPCKKDCFVKCDHTRCKKKCGFPCVSCKEKCRWNCDHFKCNKLCGNMCDRPPCNEPCQELLKCQHPCIGYCGEKCPPLCRICDKEALEEVQTWFGSDDENARFILLPECNHVIDADSLEKWLTMDDNSIKMKVCPLCKSPIQTAYRFGNIVKQHFLNVLKVKSKVFGKSGKSKDKLFQLSRKILSLKDDTEFQKSASHVQMLHGYMKNCMKKSVDAFLLNSLEARAEFIAALYEQFRNIKSKLSETKKAECLDAATDLIKAILRSIDFISDQEHSDITAECKRFHLLLQLSAVESTSAFSTYAKVNWYKNYTSCRDLIYSHSKFPVKDYDKTYDKINEIYKQLSARGVGLSKMEMDSIVSAINLHQGHWNLCPNGHVYAIADCGRAMQEGTCNECGARIGGSHHALLTTNTRLDNVPQGLN